MNNLEPPHENLPSTDKTQVLNLDMNLAECLCYVPFAAVGLIVSILWLVTEPKSNYNIRYQSAQSLVISVAFIAAFVVLWVGTFMLALIPFLGAIFTGASGLIQFLLSCGFIGLSIYLAVQAYKRNTVKLPYVSGIVETLIK